MDVGAGVELIVVLVRDREHVDQRLYEPPSRTLRADRHTLAFGERPRRQEARAVALRSRRAGVRCGRPLREPTTLIALRSPAGTPRKLIWVCGEASRLPGSGETVTAPSCSAELSRRRRGARRSRSARRSAACAAEPHPHGHRRP